MAPPAAKRVGGSVQGAAKLSDVSTVVTGSSRPMPGGSVRELSKNYFCDMREVDLHAMHVCRN